MPGSEAHASTRETLFGTAPDGSPAHLFTVTLGAVQASFTDFGARLVSWTTPDREGRVANIVMGFASVEGYAQPGNYHGAIVGRFANRLAGGRFALNGRTCQVPVNNGPNALHGGPGGFSTRRWQGRTIESGVEFTLVSPDGDMGFPGTLTATVRYTLVSTDEGVALNLDLSASTEAATVINLTNHAYFNLLGVQNALVGAQDAAAIATILGHRLMIPAERYTPTDSTQIPTGVLAEVAGTAFDFRTATPIGARIDDADPQLAQAGGYDHNFVLGEPGVMKVGAILDEPESGRRLSIETSEPGIQFYSGNFLPRSDAPFLYRTGLCLETQHFPDAPNHPGFPSTVLHPGEKFQSTTIFTCSVQP
jgi:aldose 1-epimerase